MRRFTEREYNLAVERCEALVQFSFLDFHIEYGCTEDNFVFVSIVFFAHDSDDILGDEYYWLSSPERATKIRIISLDVYNLSDMSFVTFRYNKNWDPLVLPTPQPKSRPSKRMRDNKPHRYDVAGYPEPDIDFNHLANEILEVLPVATLLPETIKAKVRANIEQLQESEDPGQEAMERIAAERFIKNHNQLIAERE
jgi:hypothetical protein